MLARVGVNDGARVLHRAADRGGGRGSTRWHGSRKEASATTRRCRPIPEEVPMFEEALLILLAIGALVLLF